jgi:hypothetical protein
LGQDGIEGKMFFASRDPEKRVDGDLKNRHPGPDQEQGEDRDRVARNKREQERSATGDQKGCGHDRFFLVLLDKDSGRNRHDAVGDEKGERKKRNQGEAEVETPDDVGDQRPDDVRQERYDEKDDEDENHHEDAAFHGFTSRPGRRSTRRF